MPERIFRHEESLTRLLAMMDILRVECPWDREQTLLSLRPFTLEEAHEVIEAAEGAATNGDWQSLRGELGDLLLQVVFYAKFADEAGEFNLHGVINELINKMIYRHPHVFADAQPDDIMEQWEQLKAKESNGRESLMDGIPPLPALAVAHKMQTRAARVGFDWPDAQGVLEKVSEEVAELQEALAEHNSQHAALEFGDLLFTLVNLGRKLGIDAETALMSSNRKFAQRFRAMEAAAASESQSLDTMNLQQLESIYQQVKARLAQDNIHG
ncbi:MAG: nucleoside triphosphate pyrophosphohydrolase [Mariprofundales bacterium]|nr:nucleoside triphosphate pyrophosphohydrolase [Mariprofundales bacterium]